MAQIPGELYIKMFNDSTIHKQKIKIKEKATLAQILQDACNLMFKCHWEAVRVEYKDHKTQWHYLKDLNISTI